MSKNKFFIAIASFFLLSILLLGSSSVAEGAEEDNGLSEKPDAAFAYLPEAPERGEEVIFYDGSFSDGSEIVFRAWDIDNDSDWEAYGQKFHYIFSEPGDHEVTLMVRDGTGRKDNITRIVSVGSFDDNGSSSGFSDYTFFLQVFIAVIIALVLIVVERRRG